MTLIETFPVSRFGRFLQHLLSHQGQDSKDGSVDGSFFRELLTIKCNHKDHKAHKVSTLAFKASVPVVWQAGTPALLDAGDSLAGQPSAGRDARPTRRY